MPFCTTGLLNSACVTCEAHPGAVRWVLPIHAWIAYQSQVPDSYAESPGILFGISQLNNVYPASTAGPCLSIPAPLVEQVKVNPPPWQTPAPPEFTTART